MGIKPGTIIFATTDCKEGVAHARAWLKASCLTPDDVRLFKADGSVLIQAKRQLDDFFTRGANNR